MKELDLGTENLGSLIKRFSIPCVISMLVAALYNIVDQIFIGWSEAGAYGNAATNIVYPFTVPFFEHEFSATYAGSEYWVLLLFCLYIVSTMRRLFEL